MTIPLSALSLAKADEVTISQNAARTGWDPNEPNLTPAIVRGSSFGKLFGTAVDGQVYAQPIVVGNTVIVATENDFVYGLNAQTGAINWQISLGPSWPASVSGCGDLVPNIGVTSTPVYDPSNGDVYVAGVVNNGPSLYQPNVYLFAINVSTGNVDWKSLVRGAPTNSPTRSFDPLTERQRASLLLMNGEVYMGFSSYCDINPWYGLITGVNTTTHAVSSWSPEAGLTNDQGGIWMSGNGVMSDAPGRLFVTTGNGISPAPGPGLSPSSQLGDATIQVGVQSDGSLAAQDFFSPANAPQLDMTDQDFGSGGPVALPFGTATLPHLLVQAGKDGRVFILNRDNLGGRGSSTDNPVSQAGPYQGQWGHPAAFAGTGGADYIYYLGKGDFLRALKFNTTNATLSDAFNSTGTFAFGSGSPVVTSNGSDPSSAVVWVVNRNSSSSTLDAFTAVPSSGNTLTPLWSAPIGSAVKFSVPATDSGRVYVGSDGMVFGFGSPDSAPLSGSPLNFGQVPVASSPSQMVTVTAKTAVTVTGVSTTSTAATDPFTTGTPHGPGGASTFPMNLAGGQTLSVPVTFAPTGPGGVTGSLNVATSTQNFSAVSVPLSGTGTQTGFYASPPSLAFGATPIGSSVMQQSVITNSGTAAEKWTTIAAPTDTAFSISGQPAAGTSISPGQSVTLSVTYQPTVTTGDTASVSEPSSLGGTAATVQVTGTGVAGQGTLTPSATSIAFGSEPLGQQVSRTVTVTNTGNLPMKLTGFGGPGMPFDTPVPVQTGITLTPGADIQLQVTFTPQSATTSNGTYALTANDGHNPAQTLTIPVSGTGAAPSSGVAVPAPGGGWRFNGSAQMTGTTLRLTKAASGQKGSAVYYQPLPSNGLHARFTTQMGGGTGADGLTFSMLDASQETPSSLGFGGGYLGFGDLAGVAVTLDTYPKNQLGIATGATSSGLQYAATTTNIPNLRNGAHVVDVTVTGSAPATITVKIDGTQYLSTQVNVPSQILTAFTASTGGLNDTHSVSSVALTSGTVTVPPPGGGWSYNGSAVMSGWDTRLTQAVTGQDGSVVYPVPMDTNGLQVTFNMQIGGGSGADGLTFSLLNPSEGPGALGAGGAELGYGGLSGVAAAFDTHQTANYPSSNFAGIAIGVVKAGELDFEIHTANGIPPLRTGTHTVVVTVNGNVLTVYMDGAQILSRSESIGSDALLAFTGADGGLSDIHAVRNAAIFAPSGTSLQTARIAQSTKGTPKPVPPTAVPPGVPTSVPPTATPPVLTLELATSGRYGPILVTSAGLTVYRSVGGCACEHGFHPLLAVPGQPLRLPVLVPGKIGSIALPNGTRQVTFNGWPLYLYSGDRIQGDTTGVGRDWRVIPGNP